MEHMIVLSYIKYNIIFQSIFLNEIKKFGIKTWLEQGQMTISSPAWYKFALFGTFATAKYDIVGVNHQILIMR